VPHFPGNYPPQNQHECGVSLEDKSALMLLTEVVTSNKGSRTPAKLGAWLSAGGAIVRFACSRAGACVVWHL
jgi:hypothetical protein